ncbi:MAG: hypothetical protein CUN53_17900, partial [Phototrophicales bacterium]
DAGRKIWLCSAQIYGDHLHIDALHRASELFGAVERAFIYPALADFISRSGESIWGMDFPFSLTQSQISHTTWTTFAAQFANDYPTPDDLYRDGKGHGRRLTDIHAKTPFDPANLRIYRQTYYGIRDLLAPLALSGRACIVPIQAYSPSQPALIEVCPASTLKRLNLYRPYKGKGAASQAARAELLCRLREENMIWSANAEGSALSDAQGDALDALIAAYAAWKALLLLHQPPTDSEALEGRVYC